MNKPLQAKDGEAAINILQPFLTASIYCVFFFAIFNGIVYAPFIGYVQVGFGIFLCLLKYLSTKKYININITGFIVAGVSLFLFIPFLVYYTGGISSPIIAWYVLTPIGTLLIFGKNKKSYIFSAISILLLCLFFVLDYAGVKYELQNTGYQKIGTLVDFIGLIVLVFIFTKIFESQKINALSSLEFETTNFEKRKSQIPGVIFQYQMFKDGTSKYIYISDAAIDILEIDIEATKENPELLVAKIIPEDFAKVRKSLSKSIKTLQNWGYLYRIITNENKERWISGNAKPEQQKDGSIIWYGYAYDATDEKKGAENLLKSQDNFNLISTTINDVFYLYDIVNKKYLYMSPNCEKILGATNEFFYSGGSYTDVYMHDDDKQKLKTVNALVDAGQQYDIDFRVVINEKIRWLNEKSYPIKDENGKTIKNSGIITDITERKLIEEKLFDTQSNINQITSTINDIFFLYDCVNKKYLFVSPNCKSVLGVDDTFFYEGNSYTDNFAHFDDRKMLNDAYEQIGDGGEYNLEYRSIIEKKQKWLNEKSYAIKNEQGEVLKISGIITDVTERKSTEEKLVKSQKSLEESQQLASIGSWEMNFINETTIWSNEMYNIFETEKRDNEDIKNIFYTKVLKADLKIIEEGLKVVTASGNKHNIEIRIHSKNDGIKYLSIIAEPIKSIKNKKLIGLKGAMQDITKQKLAALAKSNFLSTMSHEIRTPINGVIGITNLLMGEELNHTQKEYVETLHFSAQHLSTIVSDILDFSKIESGNFTFEKVAFNIEEVCNNIFKLFKSTAAEKNITYTFTAPYKIKTLLLGDYVRLSQVLSNLISNAIKFTSAGSIDFSYYVKEENDYKIKMEFIIKDTGIGIPLIQQNRIFESFLQGDDSVTREYGGTGLGLTISKKLVELQEGEISIESEVGKGSMFSVLLTFEKVNTNFVAPKKPDTQFSNETLKGLKVLVAEDNKINALVITRFLKKWNITHTIVGNGQEAIDTLLVEKFDAVLMDLQMPVLDGRAATNEIRKIENKEISTIPIIALTADALVESQKELLENGFNNCVTKPFSPEVLFKILKQYHNN